MPLFDWFTGGDRGGRVQEAFADLERMLAVGEDMFDAACAHLLDNEILDMDLEARDDEIDAREAHLRSVVLSYLTAQSGRPPVYALKLLGIVQEAERIGDLAKTIADTAALADRPRLGAAVQPVRRLRDDLRTMFELTRTCFRENDASRAEAVLALHEDRKREVRSTIASLAAGSATTLNEAVVLALGTRMLGRVSSHLANIASSVVFPFEKIRRTHADAPPDSALIP